MSGDILPVWSREMYTRMYQRLCEYLLCITSAIFDGYCTINAQHICTQPYIDLGVHFRRPIRQMLELLKACVHG
jgi:hypothetical protein